MKKLFAGMLFGLVLLPQISLAATSQQQSLILALISLLQAQVVQLQQQLASLEMKPEEQMLEIIPTVTSTITTSMPPQETLEVPLAPTCTVQTEKIEDDPSSFVTFTWQSENALSGIIRNNRVNYTQAPSFGTWDKGAIKLYTDKLTGSGQLQLSSESGEKNTFTFTFTGKGGTTSCNVVVTTI